MLSDQLRIDGFYVSSFILRPICRHKHKNVTKNSIPSTLHKFAVTGNVSHFRMG